MGHCGTRKIVLTSDEGISVFALNAVFTRVERLLMLFDGVLKCSFQNLILLMKIY